MLPLSSNIQPDQVEAWCKKSSSITTQNLTENAVTHEEITEMLNKDFLKEFRSDWCSCSVFLKKWNGSYSFCIDYRDLNKVNEEDAYTIKNINIVSAKLQKADCILKIDLKQAIMEMLVAERSQ